MKKISSFFLVCLFSVLSFAQITKPNPKLFFDTKFVTTENPILQRPDSSIENFHRHNITEKQLVPYYNLGNYGTAYYSLMFQNDNPIGFKHGFTSFDKYFNHSNTIKYYDTKTPYTYLDFVFGGKEEIVGGAEFAINVKPNYSVGFNFHRNNFKGRSKNQLSIQNLFSFQQWFRTKNNFYDLKVNFIYNGVKNEENGGWAIDSVFENQFYRKNKNLVDVNLEKASNNWSERNINIYQEFRIGKKTTIHINDSVQRKIIQPKYIITHQLSIDHWKFLYKDYEIDTISTFYSNFYYNRDSATDLTKTWTIRNGIYFKNVANDIVPKKFLYNAGMQLDFNQFKNRVTNQFLPDIQLKASIYNQHTDSSFFDYSVDANVDVAPKYIGDFSVDFFGKIHFKKTISVGVFGNISLASPSQKQEEYFGNHVRYNNSFKKIFQAKTEVFFEWKKQKLSINLQNNFLQNYIYYDTNSVSKQYNKPINIFVVKLKKEFNTKHIFSGTEIFAQWISNNSILKLPVFAIKQTVYYKGGFISKKLNAQLGFDITYNTNFMGNAYNPSMAVFHLQEKQKLTFYPILDLFFNLHVKRTNIFLRYMHVNQGMFKQKGIYTAPNYGYPDRTFRAGITWQFYD